MKTVILTTTAIFLAVVTTEASNFRLADNNKIKKERRIADKGVSNFSKEQFAFDFDHTSEPVWRRSSLFDEVAFIKDGKKLTAFYDTHSQLVGTTSLVKFSVLPINAQQEIKKNYKNYSVGSVIEYDDNELNATDIELFGLQTDAADSYFVELKKDNKSIILQVFKSGDVTYFHDMK
ncbi:hypothetical protein SAMN05518672_110132 [Chitinophaga sp. CF118]|uniref:hypothetical protein n=1 Tax=Chitinophaga sp. CF118 TaxID=1884367 RepID=UPI0008EE3711|nr:hypothetical protein [Chitinophaga sp. CF118]SFE80028.1 hypothetical protein SAMN05518672_110132 [Chitinophaga sp. CF118]